MHDESAQPVLMLSDGSNGKKNEPASKDKESGNTKKPVAFEKKKLAKKVKIDKDAQKALALSKKPEPADPLKVKERKEKYKNMSADEKEALKLQKLTVVNY